MSDEIRNKVLQVIAKLRSQKARPDIYRISYRLEKLHGVSADRTKRELDRLVADKKLYRVDFKGNHSYRIVKPTKPGGSDDVGMAELLVSALTELTAPQGRKPRKNAGASLKELRKQIYKDDNARNIRFLPQKSVEWTKLLDRLCSLNTLALQTNGKYILVEAPKDVDKRQSDPLAAKLTEKQHAELMKRESGSGGISRSSADDAINDDVPLSLVAGSDSDAEDSKPIAFLASMAVTPSTQGTKAESPCPSPSLPDPDAGETGNANAPSSSAAAVSAPPDDDDDDDVTGVTEARPEDGAGSADRNNSQHVSRDKKVSTRKQRAIKRKRCDTPTPATTTATGIGPTGPAADLLGCVSRKKHAPNKSGPVKKQTQTKSEAKATTMTMLPTAVSTSPPYKFVDHQPTCDFCLLPAERSGDVLDSLLSCSDCQARAHPSCMHYSKELANRARLAKWQCIDCKVCCVCHDAHEEIHLQGDEMLFCDSCDKGYHMNCHFPAVESKPKGNWECSKCYEKSTDNSTEYCDKYEVAYSRYPFVNKEKIPNATSWQVEDVHSYLADKGFEEQALEFKKQEIDGPSLLLMKRKDVLNSLPLRLGPALKIYYHIECLQRVALRDCLYTPSSPSSPISS